MPVCCYIPGEGYSQKENESECIAAGGQVVDNSYCQGTPEPEPEPEPGRAQCAASIASSDNHLCCVGTPFAEWILCNSKQFGSPCLEEAHEAQKCRPSDMNEDKFCGDRKNKKGPCYPCAPPQGKALEPEISTTITSAQQNMPGMPENGGGSGMFGMGPLGGQSHTAERCPGCFARKNIDCPDCTNNAPYTPYPFNSTCDLGTTSVVALEFVKQEVPWQFCPGEQCDIPYLGNKSGYSPPLPVSCANCEDVNDILGPPDEAGGPPQIYYPTGCNYAQLYEELAEKCGSASAPLNKEYSYDKFLLEDNIEKLQQELDNLEYIFESGFSLVEAKPELSTEHEEYICVYGADDELFNGTYIKTSDETTSSIRSTTRNVYEKSDICGDAVTGPNGETPKIFLTDNNHCPCFEPESGSSAQLEPNWVIAAVGGSEPRLKYTNEEIDLAAKRWIGSDSLTDPSRTLRKWSGNITLHLVEGLDDAGDVAEINAAVAEINALEGSFNISVQTGNYTPGVEAPPFNSIYMFKVTEERFEEVNRGWQEGGYFSSNGRVANGTDISNFRWYLNHKHFSSSGNFSRGQVFINSGNSPAETKHSIWQTIALMCGTLGTSTGVTINRTYIFGGYHAYTGVGYKCIDKKVLSMLLSDDTQTGDNYAALKSRFENISADNCPHTHDQDVRVKYFSRIYSYYTIGQSIADNSGDRTHFYRTDTHNSDTSGRQIAIGLSATEGTCCVPSPEPPPDPDPEPSPDPSPGPEPYRGNICVCGPEGFAYSYATGCYEFSSGTNQNCDDDVPENPCDEWIRNVTTESHHIPPNAPVQLKIFKHPEISTVTADPGPAWILTLGNRVAYAITDPDMYERDDPVGLTGWHPIGSAPTWSNQIITATTESGCDTCPDCPDIPSPSPSPEPDLPYGEDICVCGPEVISYGGGISSPLGEKSTGCYTHEYVVSEEVRSKWTREVQHEGQSVTFSIYYFPGTAPDTTNWVFAVNDQTKFTVTVNNTETSPVGLTGWSSVGGGNIWSDEKQIILEGCDNCNPCPSPSPSPDPDPEPSPDPCEDCYRIDGIDATLNVGSGYQVDGIYERVPQDEWPDAMKAEPFLAEKGVWKYMNEEGKVFYLSVLPLLEPPGWVIWHKPTAPAPPLPIAISMLDPNPDCPENTIPANWIAGETFVGLEVEVFISPIQCPSPSPDCTFGWCDPCDPECFPECPVPVLPRCGDILYLQQAGTQNGCDKLMFDGNQGGEQTASRYGNVQCRWEFRRNLPGGTEDTEQDGGKAYWQRVYNSKNEISDDTAEKYLEDRVSAEDWAEATGNEPGTMPDSCISKDCIDYSTGDPNMEAGTSIHHDPQPPEETEIDLDKVKDFMIANCAGECEQDTSEAQKYVIPMDKANPEIDGYNNLACAKRDLSADDYQQPTYTFDLCELVNEQTPRKCDADGPTGPMNLEATVTFILNKFWHIQVFRSWTYEDMIRVEKWDELKAGGFRLPSGEILTTSAGEEITGGTVFRPETASGVVEKEEAILQRTIYFEALFFNGHLNPDDPPTMESCTRGGVNHGPPPAAELLPTQGTDPFEYIFDCGDCNEVENITPLPPDYPPPCVVGALCGEEGVANGWGVGVNCYTKDNGYENKSSHLIPTKKVAKGGKVRLAFCRGPCTNWWEEKNGSLGGAGAGLCDESVDTEDLAFACPGSVDSFGEDTEGWAWEEITESGWDGFGSTELSKFGYLSYFENQNMDIGGFVKRPDFVKTPDYLMKWHSADSGNPMGTN